LDVLEHIEDDQNFISNIIKLMHSKSIIISVPAHQWLYSKADIISGHVRRYGFRELSNILLKQDLSIKFLSSFIVLSFPLMLFSRLLNFNNSPPINEHTGLINKLLLKLNQLDYLIFRYLKLKFGGTIVVDVSGNNFS
jgi:hypothetical protein